MFVKLFDTESAVNYALKYSFNYNPKYYDFSEIGGDCTNFISQCIYAGSRVMNFKPVLGWYYIDANKRTPSWTGVEYLFNFLTSNYSVGPFGKTIDIEDVSLGDIIQLGNIENRFYHSLLITKIENGQIYVSTHTFDAQNRPLSTYIFYQLRIIHIEGVRYT